MEPTSKAKVPRADSLLDVKHLLKLEKKKETEASSNTVPRWNVNENVFEYIDEDEFGIFGELGRSPNFAD
jgi:hypothetical protein